MEEMMKNEIMEAMQPLLSKEQMFVLVNYNVQRIEEWHNDISPNGFI